MLETWRGKLEDNPELIPDGSLHDIIRLALEHGANPRDIVFGIDILDTDVPLIHIAPPELVEDLIRHGAEPNTFDYRQRTPLDWAIRLPHDVASKPQDWDLKRRYDTCNLLLRHCGTCNQGETRLTLREVNGMLKEFKAEGYDVEFMTTNLSKMPGLAALREYGTLRGAQFGEGDHESELNDWSSEDGLNTTVQTRSRAYTTRIPLLGTFMRVLGNRFGESPSLSPPKGAKRREQNPLGHLPVEAFQATRSSITHDRSSHHGYHYHADRTVEAAVQGTQSGLGSSFDYDTDETAQVVGGTRRKKSRWREVKKMFR